MASRIPIVGRSGRSIHKDLIRAREIQEAGFSLRQVGYDSEIVPVSEAELIQGDEDEGRMLFLRRE
jgi:hypothetical protein